MPESRFRLERPFDIEQAFARRRSGAVMVDDARPELFATPAHQRSVVGLRGGGVAAASRLRTPIGRGRENTPPVGIRPGRAPGSVLPSWYPRTPLRDITVVMMAIERRRARMREENGEAADGQILSPQILHALSEHEVSATTPSTAKKRPCSPPSVRKVQNLLLEVANQPDEGELLTPQKKLLNSIDEVGKVVLEELHRLKSTPSAKKAERERKVRTLMSMR